MKCTVMVRIVLHSVTPSRSWQERKPLTFKITRMLMCIDIGRKVRITLQMPRHQNVSLSEG